MYTYIDQTCADDFSVVNPSTGLLVGGLVEGNFTVAIYDPDGENRADGTSLVVWSIVEKFPDSGYYLSIFTPDKLGDWLISIIHTTYFPWGKSTNYRVVSLNYYGESVSASIEELLIFILGLY